jgi:predicted nuclease of restriction endonuclease-like RecB superfamily
VLTRDLLLFRVREGRLRPSFIKREDPELLALSKELIAEVEGAKGQTRDDVEEALSLRAGAFSRPRVARGLVKLLVDRALFDDAAEGVAETRWDRFQVAAQVLRGLSPDTTLEAYEARLAEALPAPLPEVREALYVDLPGNRRLLGWEALTPADLLDRYNLALAQGPLMGARRLTLRARAPELLRVRKLLRWLKFCRLVAEVRRDGEDWALEVEGPGALLSLQKKYGLQLATFLSVVPVLERWELMAEVEASARRRAVLVLDHRDPLVSPLPAALGHIPAEVATLAESFKDAEWELDLMALPRHTGAAGLCVPDLTFRHRETGREVALELFHAWHAGPLAKRLGELRSRPDPGLLLGVDRALARGEERDALEAHPRVVLFNGFPSARRLRERLARLIEEPAPAGA